MLLRMTVCRTEEVEVPDLPQEVVDFCRERKAKIKLGVKQKDIADDRGCYEFAELYGSILSDEKSKSAQFRDELFKLKGFDSKKFYQLFTFESEEQDGVGFYFQSDMADGVEAFQIFIDEMKRLHPDVVTG